MKITKKQLKQIIKEELSKTLKEGDNIDYFAVVSPDGKVFRVKRNSERVVNDPQKAINLAATETSPRHRRGDFKVYDYAHYGGGVMKNWILKGKAENTLYEEDVLEETEPKFGFREGDSVVHKQEPELGKGKVTARGAKNVSVRWSSPKNKDGKKRNPFTGKHDGNVLKKS